MIQANKKHTQKVPLVAIHCLVYNHEPYLRDCFEGFVMQQTNFPFVAIVHDDASTDNSVEIIREYESKYPHIFKPIYQTKNQYSNPEVSVDCIVNAAIQQIGAKYIALCEGDDYWTDPLKLQKQVDFLEENPEYSFCCHRFNILKDKEQKFIHEYGYNLYVPEHDLIINEEVFFKAWVTQWLTTVVRTDLFVEVCKIAKNTFNRCLDVYIYFLLLQRGNGISLNQSMGIYRWISTGASIGRTDVQCLQEGYSIGKNLYKVFPQKVQAKNRMKYYGIRLLGYCNLCNKIDRRFYKDNIHLLDSPKEQILAFLLFIIPPFIWKFTRHIYSSFLFKD